MWPARIDPAIATVTYALDLAIATVWRVSRILTLRAYNHPLGQKGEFQETNLQFSILFKFIISDLQVRGYSYGFIQMYIVDQSDLQNDIQIRETHMIICFIYFIS